MSTFIDDLLTWDGSDRAPVRWADERRADILREAESGSSESSYTRHLPIAEALDHIEQLATSDQRSGLQGLGMAFATDRDAASAAFLKLAGFLSAAARHVRELWDALSALLQRYSPKLRAIAEKLGANGYAISLNYPFAFGFALDFDI